MDELLIKLKLLLGIPTEDTTKDVQLDIALGFTIDGVKSYCNLTEIPEGLKNTVLLIAKDYYSSEFTDEAGLMTAKSVKRGDVTTTFDTATVGAEGTSFIKNYTKQLNAYRRLRW